ncbi:MAG: hypothetical protein KC656_19990 [Myxococcales bacterium]|nr:hypothetical protein [Myxococcales bacterium]
MRIPVALVGLTLAACTPAPEPVVLNPYDVGGSVVWVPDGWTVSVDPVNQIVSMEETPGDPNTAGVLILAGLAGGPTPNVVRDVFIDVLEDSGFSALTPTATESAQGAVATEYGGRFGAVDARVGTLTLVDGFQDLFLLTAFAGTEEDYARYGGMSLVVGVLAGPPQAPATQAQSAGWSGDAYDAMGGSGFDSMWDSMYSTWSNNIGDNGWCWGDDAGCY